MSRVPSLGTTVTIGLGIVFGALGIWVGFIGFGTTTEMMLGPRGYGWYEVKVVFPRLGLALGLAGMTLLVYGLTSIWWDTSSSTPQVKRVETSKTNDHE